MLTLTSVGVFKGITDMLTTRFLHWLFQTEMYYSSLSVLFFFGRDLLNAKTVSPSQATYEGYTACTICKTSYSYDVFVASIQFVQTGGDVAFV